MIYILTGPIRSGKTSAIYECSYKRNDVDGVLCPDNLDGQRYFLKIKSKEKLKLQVKKEIVNDTISVGPFLFLKSTFTRINEFLIKIGKEKLSSYLVIDELGKLELKNEGLHYAASRLIPLYENDKNYHLVLIIRDYLLEEILKHYKLSEYTLLSKNELKLAII